MYQLVAYNLETGKKAIWIPHMYAQEQEAIKEARRLVVEEKCYDEVHVQEDGLITIFQIYRGPSGMVSEY